MLTRKDRVTRLGEFLNRQIPATIDEADFDRVLAALERSSLPDVVSDVVFAVTGDSKDE